MYSEKLHDLTEKIADLIKQVLIPAIARHTGPPKNIIMYNYYNNPL